MKRRKHIVYGFLVTAAITLLTGCQTTGKPDQNGQSNVRIHYLEIVSHEVGAQCAALERMYGLSFGPAVANLGQPRVTEDPDGSLIGVRAPLAQHEQPIIRTYLEVEDIARAVEEAEAAGAVIAYPPTQQGDTGTWAMFRSAYGSSRQSDGTDLTLTGSFQHNFSFSLPFCLQLA